MRQNRFKSVAGLVGSLGTKQNDKSEFAGEVDMKDVKKLLWIAAGIILAIALACGINLWQNAQVIRWQTDHMPELQHILTFAENKGADWATDELMISGVDGFRKKSLYKKWGNPTESEDIWVLSDQFQLVVDYDKHERIESVKVVPST